MKLRAWQQEALDKYSQANPRDFLVVATPGAGKTTFALTLAQQLFRYHEVERIIIVVPTEHLKKQWSDSARGFGLHLNPDFGNSDPLNTAYDGIVVTYAQVGMNPYRHSALATSKKSLIILDEIHHAGDAKSWGNGIKFAYEDAHKRLALTGTPFRSDDSPIPFIQYKPVPGGYMVSHADHSYDYANALADGVVRPVMFMAYSGHARWRDSAGEEYEARIGEILSPEQNARAWRTALDPQGEWIPTVLQAAHKRLKSLRESIPDAGGLVIATDKETARAYAQLLGRISGSKPTVILSDDPQASKKIKEFSEGTSEWMVAVRMVSEGVDVPRLAVGVYATSSATPLFFAQAIGRFVRKRAQGEVANIFIPSVPVLLELASELERQRNHVLGMKQKNKEGFDNDLLAQANRPETEKDDSGKIESLEAQAELSSLILDGHQFATEEEDFLGLPGLLSPDDMKKLLQSRESQVKATLQSHMSLPKDKPSAQEREKDADQLPALRKQLNALVAMASSRTGRPHGSIHNEIRRKTGGPATALCSADQLRQRISLVRKM